MRTIGRHVPKSRRRDAVAVCDTCGVRYYRSKLVRGPDGLLRCSGAGTNDDAKGRTAFELGELAAARAADAVYESDELADGTFDSGEDDL